MQVYVEIAVLENFCMDFTLLYCAKLVSKNAASFGRIAFGSAVGACFAVTFPLFNLSSAWAVAVKILSGFLICLVSGKFKSLKGYLKFSGAFLAFTALLGGALIGIFSLTGTEYSAGGGFILSSVPAGIPLFAALIAAIGAKKLAARLAKSSKNSVICRIYAGQSQVCVNGFFDSGNKVYINGQPVSVIPWDSARKLLDTDGIKDGVKIHTVAGSKTMKVFTADRLEIADGGKTAVYSGVKIGVSPHKINRAVLHCDLLEDINV